MRRLSLVLVPLGLALGGCPHNGSGGDAAPEDFGTNVIIGDARAPVPADAEPDAEAADGGLDAEPEAGAEAEAEAGLDALPVDTGPDCSGVPVATLTASAAVAMASRYAEMIVLVTGTASVGARHCTTAMCPPNSPCCNACKAAVSIDGRLPLAAGVCFDRVGCVGNECTLTCLPPVIGIPQSFRGILHAPLDAGPTLELRAPPSP
jgi:hypothetical protein